MKTQEDNNTLANSYKCIRLIPETFILSNYHNQNQPEKDIHSSPIEIFPFAFQPQPKRRGE